MILQKLWTNNGGKNHKNFEKGEYFHKNKGQLRRQMVFAVRGFLLPNRLFYDQPRLFCSSQLEGKNSILQLEGFAVRGVSTVLIIP